MRGETARNVPLPYIPDVVRFLAKRIDMHPPVTLVCCSGTPVLTSRQTLLREPESRFAKSLSDEASEIVCVDRDPKLVRHIVNALRHPEQALILPDDFTEWNALADEARYWVLPEIERQAKKQTPQNGNGPSTIIIAYHGTLTFGKQGMAADVNFRKIARVLVSGKMSECKQIFGESLNAGRDGDMGEDRYTCRVYLKHTYIEHAFDQLAAHGYNLVAASSHPPASHYLHHKDEQECYMHYSQFTFQKH